MKAYICDACDKAIIDPHEIKMKEFYVGIDIDFGGLFPKKERRKLKIHLCDNCYRGLGEIARKKISEDNE